MAINTQNIRIDLNPGRSIPVAFMHQNDTNRQLTFELYNNGVAYTPASGSTVKFAYKSPIVNGRYSVITGSEMATGTISGSTVTVTLPVKYTQVSGVGILTMILTTSGNTLRPVNIKFVVQNSADGDDTILAASDWPEGLYEYMDDWLAENEPTEIANLKSDLNPLVYDTATLTDGTTYVEIPYTIGQKVVIETINGENLASDCIVYAYDSEKTYLNNTIVSASTNKKGFTSTINATFLRCSSAPSTPLKVTVIDESKLVYKFDALSKDVEALEETSTIVFSMADVYERKEVSASYNMYEIMTAEVVNRARAKQEHIQEVPTGATSVHVDISADSLANGKYKVGWAFYTDNYVQIRDTVRGWYTASTSFDATVPNDGKYFMLYFATNSASEITLDEIDIAKNSIVFNNSSIDYAKAMVNTPLSFLYAETNEKIEALEASITASGDNNYFIYSVNHRGYSLEAPENTIPAYILSKKHGFTYAECDVEFTSDEVAVLLHDSTINRTARNTDGTTISSTINIGDITYNQALAYDFGIWKGSEWAGTPIPTFDEFILACKKLSLHPFIELKDSVNGTYWTDARIASVANSIKNVGMESNVSFISFAISALQKIAVHFPTARLGLGFEGTYSTENFNAFVSNAESLLSADREVIATVNYGSMTDELYSILTEAGIKPLVWTVNSSSVVLSLDETVIGVLSDNLNAGKIILENMLGSIS